jgi:hypothetical protein
MLFLCMLSAMAEDSIPQEVSLREDVSLFVDVGLDSGWVPSSGALGVRIELVANGNMGVEEDGMAHLSWPEDLTLNFEGFEDGGLLSLDTVLATIISIRFDVAGYQYEAPISTFDIPFSEQLIFDSFSVGTPLSLQAQSDNNVVDFSTTLLFVVDVAFYGVVRPSVSLDFHPIQWDVEGELIEQEGGKATFTPQLGAESWDGEALHLAEINAQLDVEFVPTFEVCVPILGCTQWEATQIPLSSNTDAFIHEFSPEPLSFPLPALSIAQDPIDFGSLSEGSLSNYELGLENIGLLLLSGEASIVSGMEYFSVYPEYFLASEGSQDGVMISFLGAEEGSYEGIVEILSNDPAQPSIQIELFAQVVAEEDDGEELGGKEVEGGMVGGCGCSTQKTPPLELLTIFPLLALYRRKR